MSIRSQARKMRKYRMAINVAYARLPIRCWFTPRQWGKFKKRVDLLSQKIGWE